MPLSSTPLRANSTDGQLELATDQARITQLPGTKNQIALSLHNNSASPLPVELSAKGLPGDWVSLNPSTLRLASVQSASAALTFSPSPDAPTGDYPLLVLAQVTDHPETAVRLNLILEIAEPGKLTVTILPAQAEGQAQAEFQVQLAQTGVESIALGLSAKDEENACEYTFEPQSLVLQANGNVASRLVVRARQGLAGVDSRTFAFTVTATATQGAAVIGTAPGRFLQRRAEPLQLTLVPNEQRGPDRVDYTVRLANGSQVQTTIRLSTNDPEGACRFQFSPASLTLPPNGQAQATLTVVPLQQQSGGGEKIHTFTVRAEPTGELLSPVQAEGRFIQTAAVQPAVTIRPPSQSKSGAANYTLQVKNPRAEPLDVELTASDANGASTYVVTPARLQIPPNGAGTAQLSVRPTAVLLPGEARRTYPFTVQARFTDMPDPSTAEGSLTLVKPSRLLLYIIGAGLVLALVLCVAAALVVRGILGSQVARIPTAIAIATVPPTQAVPVILPSETLPPVATEIPIQPTDTSAPTDTVESTNAPLPTITPSPTQPPATATPFNSPLPRPRPSSTPTPSIAPGVYVTALRVVPVSPPSGHPSVHSMVFIASFLNTTNAPQGYVYRVDVYLSDRSKSHGITSAINITVPVGASELQSGTYNINACDPLSARVIHEEGPHKLRVPFVKPDGSDFWFDFVVCH